jgi:hypothetical protein
LSAKTVAQKPDGSVRPPLSPGQPFACAPCWVCANAADPASSKAENDAIDKAAAHRRRAAREATRSDMTILPLQLAQVVLFCLNLLRNPQNGQLYHKNSGFIAANLSAALVKLLPPVCSISERDSAIIGRPVSAVLTAHTSFRGHARARIAGMRTTACVPRSHQTS